MRWCLMPLQKYAVFSGRARRKEYWLFQLFSTLLIIGFAVLAIAIDPNQTTMLTEMLCSIPLLLLLLPSLTVTVRRLHDTNRSGWWIFIYVVPYIGPIWLFILMVFSGSHGPNRFGEDPKEEGIRTVLY